MTETRPKILIFSLNAFSQAQKPVAESRRPFELDLINSEQTIRYGEVHVCIPRDVFEYNNNFHSTVLPAIFYF